MSDLDQEIIQTPALLTLDDARSPTWVKLKKHMESRRDRLREKNDDVNLTPFETQVLRGRIEELKNLLDLAPKPASAEGDVDE